MNKKDFFELSYDYILVNLIDKSFKWNKRQESLVKSTKTGNFSLSLYFNKFYSEYTFSEDISLRIDSVEIIRNYFSLRNHSEDKYTSTHATSLGIFTNHKFDEFSFTNNEELYKKLDIYINFLNDKGLEYLNHCSDIYTLADLYINNKEDIHIACKGAFAYKTALILAILTNTNLNRVATEFKEKYLMLRDDTNDYSYVLDSKLYEFAMTGIIPDLPPPPYEALNYQTPPKPILSNLQSEINKK
jgi:hypothetical protein